VIKVRNKHQRFFFVLGKPYIFLLPILQKSLKEKEKKEKKKLEHFAM